MAHSSPTAKQNPVIPICFIIFVLRYNYPYLYRDVAGSPVKKLTKCQVFYGAGEWRTEGSMEPFRKMQAKLAGAPA